ATLIARAMPVPPPGSQYEIWLNGEDGRLSLGVFVPDERGQGELTFSNPDGLNLISRYDTVEITFEPTSDGDPEPSGLLAYSYTLPEEELTHIRFLLSTFAKTPDKSGLAQGLYADVKQIAALSDEMQNAVEGDDDAAVRQAAEAALNLLVGAMSDDHKDWNDDGEIASPDSYGLLVNGSNFGYVQSVYAEADVTVHTPGVSQYMAENGEVVKTCAQNVGLRAPKMSEVLLAILRAATDTGRSESVRAFAVLTDQMLNGVDVDNNGTVDNLPGECGAAAVYEYAYYMADMPIMPVSISYQLTVAANPTLFVISPTPGGAGSPAITPTPRPTKVPRPTKEPRPTKTERPKVPKQ
ncbi:MAG: anti-sigma factor, partial [Anaerolineales bacterium]